MKQYKDVNEAIEDLTMIHILDLNKKEEKITDLKCKIYALTDELEILKKRYNHAKHIITKQNEDILNLKISLDIYRSSYGLGVGDKDAKNQWWD